MSRERRELEVAGGHGRELTEVEKLARWFVRHPHTKRSLQRGIVLDAGTSLLWVIGALLLFGDAALLALLGMALGALTFAGKAISNVIVLRTYADDASKHSGNTEDD